MQDGEDARVVHQPSPAAAALEPNRCATRGRQTDGALPKT
jgi:hypothetical protein